MSTHEHKFQAFHADYCHRSEWGEMCGCGVRRSIHVQLRDFSRPESAWWYWGKAGCGLCEALMERAGLNPAALGDERLACAEIDRQFPEWWGGR